MSKARVLKNSWVELPLKPLQMYGQMYALYPAGEFSVLFLFLLKHHIYSRAKKCSDSFVQILLKTLCVFFIFWHFTKVYKYFFNNGKVILQVFQESDMRFWLFEH